MTRGAVVRLGILGLALWAALGLAVNVRHLQWRQAGDRWFDSEPCLWRYGTPPTDRLERRLDALRSALAEAGDGLHGPVLFASGFEGQDALCAYLWATYLLPEVTLRQAPAAGVETGPALRLDLDLDAPLSGAARVGHAEGDPVGTVARGPR